MKVAFVKEGPRRYSVRRGREPGTGGTEAPSTA
jgi:hypothetical protein